MLGCPAPARSSSSSSAAQWLMVRASRLDLAWLYRDRSVIGCCTLAGPGLIAVTLGADGEWLLRRLSASTVRECLSEANRVAAMTCTRSGAEPPTRAQMPTSTSP